MALVEVVLRGVTTLGNSYWVLQILRSEWPTLNWLLFQARKAMALTADYGVR